MHGNFSRRLIALLAVALAASASLCAQQDSFRWMDFHSEKDQSVIVWVTRALTVENWTAIREIGVVYDAALVVTTDRATPQSPANADTFTVWSVSLTSHVVAPLVRGVNLRWLEGMRFTPSGPEEQAVLYDNCRDCAAITYFTAFRYDMPHHMWTSRWLRGGQAVPVWSANVPAGVVWTQVYAGLAEPDGRTLMATWSHFDYGRQKPPDDFVYRYDVDLHKTHRGAQPRPHPAGQQPRQVRAARHETTSTRHKVCPARLKARALSNIAHSTNPNYGELR